MCFKFLKELWFFNLQKNFINQKIFQKYIFTFSLVIFTILINRWFYRKKDTKSRKLNDWAIFYLDGKKIEAISFNSRIIFLVWNIVTSAGNTFDNLDSFLDSFPFVKIIISTNVILHIFAISATNNCNSTMERIKVKELSFVYLFFIQRKTQSSSCIAIY